MHLEQLVTLQILKAGPKSSSNPAPFENSSLFYWETCQRKMWIGLQKDVGEVPTQIYEHFKERPERAEGPVAYGHLLKVCLGLESRLLGEADVFGQFKAGWKSVGLQNPALSKKLGPFIRRLFEDTKEIKKLYLENLGGQSYGTLARKLLNMSNRDSVLFVGAGQLARSLLPYFKDHAVSLWTRTSDKACALHRSFPFLNIVEENLEKIILDHSHILVCAPSDQSLGQKILEGCREATTLGKRTTLLHMGSSCSFPLENPLFQQYHLEDILKLAETVSARRTKQTERAKMACLERARLRSLTMQSAIPHGWEDLMAFSILVES